MLKPKFKLDYQTSQNNKRVVVNVKYSYKHLVAIFFIFFSRNLIVGLESKLMNTINKSIHKNELKELVFSILKPSFIYFNTSLYNTLSIKNSISTYNILKQYKQHIKIIYPTKLTPTTTTIAISTTTTTTIMETTM